MNLENCYWQPNRESIKPVAIATEYKKIIKETHYKNSFVMTPLYILRNFIHASMKKILDIRTRNSAKGKFTTFVWSIYYKSAIWKEAWS